MELKNPLWYPFTEENYEDGVRQIRTWMGSENRLNSDPLVFIIERLFERLMSESHDYSGVLRPYESIGSLVARVYSKDNSAHDTVQKQFEVYRATILELDNELTSLIAETRRPSLKKDLTKIQSGVRWQFGVAATIHDRSTAVTRELNNVVRDVTLAFPIAFDRLFVVNHHFAPLAVLRDQYTFSQASEALQEFLEQADFLLELEQLQSIGFSEDDRLSDAELTDYRKLTETAVSKLHVAVLMQEVIS